MDFTVIGSGVFAREGYDRYMTFSGWSAGVAVMGRVIK